MKGWRYEGVDGRFYGELIHALCYAGRPVSASVAADTRAAMDEAEKRQSAGEDLWRKETRQEAPGEVELQWDIEPVETACEGLEILAMVGAPEAPPLFMRALGSQVRSCRWAAVHSVSYIGEGDEQLLPVLGALLDGDDMRLREDVLWQLECMLDRAGPSRPPTDDDEPEDPVQRCKQRLRELGHLR